MTRAQRQRGIKYVIIMGIFFIMFAGALTVFNEMQREQDQEAAARLCQAISDVNNKLNTQNRVTRAFLQSARQARRQVATNTSDPEQTRINEEAAKRYKQLIEAMAEIEPVKCPKP